MRDSPTIEKVSISKHDPFSNDDDDADARASLRATGGKGRNMGCGAWIEDSAVGDANVMSGCQWERRGTVDVRGHGTGGAGEPRRNR